ncbi:hypothetical protein BTO28_11660 [Domibacillus epiphyticus]|uniref:Uncharacterized protein n=1 Tax=Domibacillus epiphyticus TaxID=1714355 RepID=A0A1V2A6S2_9BACI|nr:hypothetical protein BTO28_11660 [Domibacillus epiphyticus]
MIETILKKFVLLRNEQSYLNDLTIALVNVFILQYLNKLNSDYFFFFYVNGGIIFQIKRQFRKHSA